MIPILLFLQYKHFCLDFHLNYKDFQHYNNQLYLHIYIVVLLFLQYSYFLKFLIFVCRFQCAGIGC